MPFTSQQTGCFTGHRHIPAAALPAVRRQLDQEIARYAAAGIRQFCAGGALGFDTLAAQAVLRQRCGDPRLSLTLCLPCRDQDRQWPEEDRRVYASILAQADHIDYVTEQYAPGCMQQRNRRLVDQSSVCICYCIRRQGGTAYTVQYALRCGLTIVNLADSAPACPVSDS